MSWPIQKVIPPAAPKKIVRQRWSRLVTLISVASFLAFYFINTFHYDTRLYRVLGISVTTLSLLFLILYALRCYKYGVDLDYNQKYNQSKKDVENQWKEWCDQYLVIIDSKLILPFSLDKVAYINDKEFMVRKENAALLNDGSRSLFTRQRLIRELLYSLRGRLQEVAALTELDVVFAKEPDSFSEHDFINSWEKMNLTRNSIAGFHFISSDYEEKLTGWLKKDINKTVIVIDFHLNDLPDSPDAKTEFAALFLLTNNSKLEKLRSQARLLRPQLSLPEKLADDIADMLCYQSGVATVKNIWCSNLSNDLLSTLTVTINQQFIAQRYESVPPTRNNDIFFGPSVKNSIWLALALALTAVEKQQTPQLVACGSSGRLIINTLVPSSKVMEHARNENV